MALAFAGLVLLVGSVAVAQTDARGAAPPADAPSAGPPPGGVLELTFTGTLSAAQVDAQTAGRFRNDGERPPRARTAVDTYLLRYATRGHDGAEAAALAQLFVPQDPMRVADRSLLLAFAPGSTGLVEACAPSRGWVESRRLETYGATTLAYAGQGIVAVMPNYLGFFDVGLLQPYFVADAEAHAVLDALRAVPLALAELGRDLALGVAFVAGFSQGGHAAFAAADAHTRYAPEVPLRGVLGFGASTQIAATFEEFTYVAPWILHAWSVLFPERIDPDAILVEPYARSLAADAERLCIAGVQRYYPSGPEYLYRPAFLEALQTGTLDTAFPGFAALAADNDAGLTGHGFPAIVLQGVDDPVVSLATQDAFVAELCALGSAVRYPNYLRTRHETRYIGFPDAVAWMRDLAGGVAPPDDCAQVTSP